jgi:ABC-type cobalamin/Fe3+-siderophores transport system ATPase subunit
MVAEVVLDARGLVKDYRRNRAVDGIDLVVHAGERVALLGPNGAGKTTTLLMILGVVSPDEGAVSICGFDLARHRGYPAAKPTRSAAGAMGTELSSGQRTPSGSSAPRSTDRDHWCSTSRPHPSTPTSRSACARGCSISVTATALRC